MHQAEKTHRPSDVHVTYRKMEFEFEKTGFDKRWHDGSAFISYFWGALSTAFPPGEKFFMDSAKALRDQIDDPELLEEIAEFVRQEGHHTFQHQKFNRMLGELGFDVALYESRYARVLNRAADTLDPMGWLAATMALEHFTAGFAHQYLTNEAVSAGADPNVRALWAWHAAEEAEHKATCFDLYQRLGGGYFRRVVNAPAAWGLLLFITFHNLSSMLRKEGRLFDLRDNARGLWYLFGTKGLVTKLMPAFFAYFRPDFHPWQENDASLIAQWQAQNARYIKSTHTNASANPSATLPSLGAAVATHAA